MQLSKGYLWSIKYRNIDCAECEKNENTVHEKSGCSKKLVKSLYNYQEASTRIIHEFVSGIFSMFISIRFIHGVVLSKCKWK